MSKKGMVNFRLDDALKERIRKAAEQQGVTRSALFRECVLYYLSYSDEFLFTMRKLAEGLKLKPSFVIKRLALAHLAEAASREARTGTPPEWREFDRTKTDRQFYQAWRARQRSV